MGAGRVAHAHQLPVAHVHLDVIPCRVVPVKVAEHEVARLELGGGDALPSRPRGYLLHMPEQSVAPVLSGSTRRLASWEYNSHLFSRALTHSATAAPSPDAP